MRQRPGHPMGGYLPIAAGALAVACAWPLKAQAPPVFELVEDLRIGAIDEPDYNLESPGHLIVGPDGSIYVTEPNRGEVLVYDEGGRFVRRIGGRGEGPGEFRSTAGGIGWSGNELWVVDPFLVRITSEFAEAILSLGLSLSVASVVRYRTREIARSEW